MSLFDDRTIIKGALYMESPSSATIISSRESLAVDLRTEKPAVKKPGRKLKPGATYRGLESSGSWKT